MSVTKNILQLSIVRKLCDEACRANYDKPKTADAIIGAFVQYAEDELVWSKFEIADYLELVASVVRKA